MNASGTRRLHMFGILCAVFAGVLLVDAEAADAQMGGGRSRGGGRRPTKKPNTPPPADQPQDVEAPGQQVGRIIKFKGAKEGEEDETLLGTLSVQPFKKGGKTLKLLVRKSDTLRIDIGDTKIEGDEILEYLWKGLHCTAGWAFEDSDAKKPKKKALRTLKLDTLAVVGKLDSIEDNVITLKARPANGQDWPDLIAKLDSGADPSRGKKKVVLRKLKLKILENVSKFEDAKKDPLDLGEFEVGKDVDATIVLGRPFGILVVLQSPTAENREKPDEPQTPRDEGGGGKHPGRPRRPGARGR